MKITRLEGVCLAVLLVISVLFGLRMVHREDGRGALQTSGSGAGERTESADVVQGAEAVSMARSEDSDGDGEPADGSEPGETARHIRLPAAVSGDAAGAVVPPEKKVVHRPVTGSMLAEDMIRTLEEILGQPWSPDKVQKLQSVLAKWSASDPGAALEYAMTIDSRRARNQILSSLIGTWAKSDPQGAYVWAAANLREDAGAFESAVRTIFGEAASQNADAAMRSALAMPAGGGRIAAYRAVVERAVRDGLQMQMAAHLSSITDPQEARAFATSLAQNWAVQDPLAAADWAMALEDPSVRNAALSSVVGSWTSDQPQRAAEWVLQLPAGPLRDQQMSQLTQTWAGFDPVGTADWLIGQRPPSPQLDPAIKGLVSSVMRVNPEGAMTWAGAISNPRLRNNAMESVARQWMRQNPQQAAAYIAQSSLPPQVRQKLLRGR